MKVTLQMLAERIDQHVASTDERFAKGNTCFAEIKALLEVLSTRTEGIEQLRTDVAATREIVEAMATVKNMAKFLKWLGGVAAAFAAFLAMIKAFGAVIGRGAS